MHQPNFYKTAENSIISFEWTTTKNNFLSEKEGRPVFDKVLRGIVRSPGQQKSSVAHDIIREDINGQKRTAEHIYSIYRDQIEAFLKNEKGGGLQGTPIDEWKEIGIERAASLKSLNIYTVEALAELSDSGLQNVGMDARQLQAKARAYIIASKDKTNAVELAQNVAKENAELREEIKELRELVLMLQSDSAGAKPPASKKGKIKAA